jgi:signal transduction histidine kinase
MRRVAGAIAAGNYSSRITVTTHDEIAELADDLNRMADSLQRVEQLRRDMVADVAHELRTPLTNMRGYLEGMLDGVVPANKDKLALIHEESLRLASLVDDLLRLAEADAATASIRCVSVDLAPLVRSAVSLFQQRAEQTDILIEARVDQQASAAMGDPDKLTQITHNLLDNAVRYSEPSSTITISVGWSGEHVRLAFENTPATPPPADFMMNFERFHRGEKSRSRQYGGAGLGLAIVRRLVEAQGGTVRSEADRHRVRITVLLPRAD